MSFKVINFKNKFSKFNDLWSPKVISELNNYQFKLVKINNDFIWHKHDDTDEAFIVIEGRMFIDLRNETVEINEGEMIVIPKGTEHKPFSKKETKVMIIEPKGVTNTGNKRDKLTAPNNTWI